MTLLSSGGLFREVSQAFVGPLAMRFFAAHYADVAFISVTGLDPMDGLTDPNPLEIEEKRALCRRVDRMVRLLDHSKFGRRSLTPALSLRDINYQITSTSSPRPFLGALANANTSIEIIHA